MYRSSTAYKQKQSKTVLNLYVCEFRCERTTGGGLFHWKKRYYCLSIGVLARINGLNLKNFNDWFVSNKHAAFHITRLNWSTKAMLWIIVIIVSCLDSHSDGTHSLYRGEWYITLNFSKSVPMEKKICKIWMTWGWVFSANFHFWVNYSFKGFITILINAFCTVASQWYTCSGNT